MLHDNFLKIEASYENLCIEITLLMRLFDVFQRMKAIQFFKRMYVYYKLCLNIYI